MKQVVAIILVFAVFSPLSAFAAVRTKAKTVAKSVAKKGFNCSDFTTQLQAQDFFVSNGGPGKDPHKLDGDKDGIACESLK